MPNVLDEALASGVFLHAQSPEQATRFLLDVFAPCLRRWANPSLVMHIHAAKLLVTASLVDFKLDGNQDLILLVSDVHLLAGSPSGNRIMKLLKARRDEINLRKDAAGRFILVAAGSPGDVVTGMANDSREAFFGATSMPIPFGRST